MEEVINMDVTRDRPKNIQTGSFADEKGFGKSTENKAKLLHIKTN
jgi:hypothetical protein